MEILKNPLLRIVIPHPHPVLVRLSDPTASLVDHHPQAHAGSEQANQAAEIPNGSGHRCPTRGGDGDPFSSASEPHSHGRDRSAAAANY